MVWGACVVFFQAALLLGYMYAHYIIQWRGIQKYRLLHGVLILLPLLFFPGHALALKYTSAGLPMVLEIFWRLILTIGPAFFVLSTMSIVWQCWLSQSNLPERQNPYTLFAVSNLGSFAGLLTYPFLFEMYFDLGVQQTIWRMGYVILVILQWMAFKWITVQSDTRSAEIKSAVSIDRGQIINWLLYGAVGVIVFLATTNLMTSELAPVPLFWMLPLAIYLLTFVLNFKRRPWCPSWIWKNGHAIIVFGIVLYFAMLKHVMPLLISVSLLLAYTFIVCMFAQYHLHASKPADHRSLSYFYFMVSLGSFLGGIAATWIVPLISPSYLEYFLALLALAFVLRNGRSVAVIGIALIIIFQSPIERVFSKEKYTLTHRNYYGITKIFEQSGVRFLVHGSTIHGAQYLDPEYSRIPLTYYNPKSPPAEILIRNKSLNNIGLVGLGTGSLVSYLDPGQKADYYELDPDMLDIAKKYFKYLDLTAGDVRHIIGDARLTLENSFERYHLLIVDAFSGDSVPLHLLTGEAIGIYRNHINPDGVILFHVANRYIDFRPALYRTAFEAGARVAYQHNVDFISKVFHSDWVCITWSDDAYQSLVKNFGWTPISADSVNDIRPWTDSYSNILPYFKINEILQAVRYWK